MSSTTANHPDAPPHLLPAELTALARSAAGAHETDDAVGQTLGRYKLLEKVGEGGCGAVYVAEQTEPVRRRVALKIIKLGMDTRQVVARFEAERQALAMMDHPNIAKVLDAGTTDGGRAYFVMELVRGIRITDYCDQANLSTRERIDLFIRVCQAIQHAHQKGIIHRDIKPSNILVTLHDGVPVPKVIDFGIAKATEGRLTDATVYTQLHQFIGTPAYMSPEQAEMSGLDIDTRSDIYSLGVLLYELLVGTTPFDAKELMSRGIDAMRKTIREKDPVRPSTRFATLRGDELTTTARRRSADTSKLMHQLKGDLDWIAMKCLEKDRTRRYETANGLAADLKRHLNYEPVVARPPSTLYRCQKAFHRNKLVFGSAALIAAALLVAAASSTGFLLRERQARVGEQVQRHEAEAQRRAAQAAQADATEQRDVAQNRLLDSLVREMHSIAAIRDLGYRKELRERVRQALELPKASQRLDQLRAQFAQGLGDALGLEPVVVNWQTPLPWNELGQMALSPEGHLAAVWTSRSGLEILDVRAGKRIALFVVERVYSPAFSSDGQKLFGLIARPTDSVDPASWARFEVLEWERESDGAWARRQRFSQPVSALRGTTAGVFVLQPASDRTLQVLNLETGRVLGTLSPAEEINGRPRALDLAPGRGLLALGSDTDGAGYSSAVVVSSLTQPQLRFRLESYPGMGRIAAARFSPDERLLLCMAENGAAVFETANFKSVGRILGYHGSSSGAFFGDGTAIAFSGGQRPGLRLHSLNSGTDTHLRTRELVGDLTTSMDGTTLMFADMWGLSFVRLAESPERRRLLGHVGGVPSVEFSPDGRVLASTGKDGSVRFWNSVSGQLERTIARSNAMGQTVCFSPDGAWVAVGDYQHDQIKILSAHSGQEVLSLGEARPGYGQTWGAAFAQGGRRFVAVGANGLRLWELVEHSRDPSNSPLAGRLLEEKEGYFRNLEYDPAGQWIAFSGLTNRPGSWRIFTRRLDPGSPVESFPVAASYAVQSLGLVPGRGELAYTASDGEARELQFWNFAKREVSQRLPLMAPGERVTTYISNLRFSADGTRLAAANHDGRRVNIYDVAQGRRLYSLPDEPGVVWWLAWHPQGRQLAVARESGDISLWNLPEVEAALADAGLAP